MRQVRQGDVRTRGERSAARVAQRAPLQRTHTRGGGAKGRGQTTQRSNATPRKTNQRTRRTPPLKGAPMRWMKSPNACSETNGAPERGLKQPTKTCYLPSPANREVARTKPRSFSLAFDASEERRENGYHSLTPPLVPLRSDTVKCGCGFRVARRLSTQSLAKSESARKNRVGVARRARSFGVLSNIRSSPPAHCNNHFPAALLLLLSVSSPSPRCALFSQVTA